MRYILIDELRRQNCIKEIQGLDISKPLEVTIKPYKRKRSNAQNNLYWSYVAPMAKHLGYTEDELHEVLKVRFIGIEEKTVAGQKLIMPISTTSLSTKQMGEFLLKVEALAATNNIVLRRPDDYNLAVYGK